VVIGSGMGGGVLADALSDAGRPVLVLEAGSLLYPTHITNLPGDWARLAPHHQVGHFINEPGSEFLFGVQMNPQEAFFSILLVLERGASLAQACRAKLRKFDLKRRIPELLL